MVRLKIAMFTVALLAAAVWGGASAAVSGVGTDDRGGPTPYTGSSAVPLTDDQADDTDAHHPQLTGPPGEFVPIGSVPKELRSSAPAAGPSTGAVEDEPIVAQSFFECRDEPHNGFCIWQHINYEGLFWFYDRLIYSKNTWYDVGSSADNRASSIYNKRINATWISRLFPPSMPDIVCVPGQIAYGDLTQYRWPSGKNANDTISGFNMRTRDC